MSQSPQKQRAARIVEMVIYQNERVPSYIAPADKEEPDNNYEGLSKKELLKLLEDRDSKILQLLREKDAVIQTAAAREQECTQVLENKKEQEKLLDSMQKTVKSVTSSQKRLQHQRRVAHTKGYEEGKRDTSKLLESIFSESQVRALLSKKRVVWGTEDIASAVALHACSRKAYKFVKYKMHIPLPSEATIKRWASKIQIRPGLQEDVLIVLGKLSSTLSPVQRLVCLSFDEVMLSQRAQYDAARDAVVGPNSHAQVVMMRPLQGDWKQPIYFGLDEAMTPALYDKIVEHLYQIGFIVVATVCDLGPSNQGFLSELGVYRSDVSYVEHPCDKELKIHFFADVPHMLKLLRNHIIDKGINYGGDNFGAEILRTTINLVNR